MKRFFIKFFITVAVCALCAFLGYKAYLRLTDQTHIEETVYQVESDKIISSVRLAVLSDLHLSVFGEDNRELVERVRLWKPDLIVIAGDMNRRQEDDYSVVISLCKQLQTVADVYYAMGNHEISRMLTHNRDIYYDIEATGVTMLHNAYTQVKIGGNTLMLGGVSQAGAADIEAYSEGIIERLADTEGYKILVSHYPSNYPLIYPYDIDLVLSGHLHGGQINLPYFDGLYSAEDGFFPNYTEGMFEENGTVMIVSRGLGNSSAIPRINNDPELVIVDISGSAVTYNTLRLLAQNDENSEAIADETNREDAYAGKEGGHMLELMGQAEEKNQTLAETLLEAQNEG